MSHTDTREQLTAQVESVLYSLTWQGIAERAREESGDEYPRPGAGPGLWEDEDGDELTADEAFHAHNPHDAPALVWLEDRLEITVTESRGLWDTDRESATVDYVRILCTYGGPNVYADWDGSRWHVHGHWGGEEVHRYVSRDEIGVGDYLDEVVNAY